MSGERYSLGTCRYCGQNDIAVLIARGYITSAVVNVRGQCRAKISLTSKEKIKVERSETRSYQLEE